MTFTTVRIIAFRALRDALAHRWLWAAAAGFVLLTVGLARAATASAGYAGLGGFSRTAASLLQGVLLLVPLIGIGVGTSTFAAERERGALAFLLAQPITRGELFLGRVVGSCLAVVATVLAGFGAAGLVLAWNGASDSSAFVGLAVLSALLGVCACTLGVAISAATRRSSTAHGVGLAAWLVLVLFGDLGYLGAVLFFSPSPPVLISVLLANPLQVFKLAAVQWLDGGLEGLGPVGQYATTTFGGVLDWAIPTLLVAWAFAAGLAGYLVFVRREACA